MVTWCSVYNLVYVYVPLRDHIVMSVIGTGTNACYLERLERVQMWDGSYAEPRQVIN